MDNSELLAWVRGYYGVHTFCERTLYNWRRQYGILPQPEKLARAGVGGTSNVWPEDTPRQVVANYLCQKYMHRLRVPDLAFVRHLALEGLQRSNRGGLTTEQVVGNVGQAIRDFLAPDRELTWYEERVAEQATDWVRFYLEPARYIAELEAGRRGAGA